MQKSYGWEPSVIAATAAEKDKADKYFPNATFVDLEDLKFGKCNYLNLKKFQSVKMNTQRLVNII